MNNCYSIKNSLKYIRKKLPQYNLREFGSSDKTNSYYFSRAGMAETLRVSDHKPKSKHSEVVSQIIVKCPLMSTEMDEYIVHAVKKFNSKTGTR